MLCLFDGEMADELDALISLPIEIPLSSRLRAETAPVEKQGTEPGVQTGHKMRGHSSDRSRDDTTCVIQQMQGLASRNDKEKRG